MAKLRQKWGLWIYSWFTFGDTIYHCNHLMLAVSNIWTQFSWYVEHGWTKTDNIFESQLYNCFRPLGNWHAPPKPHDGFGTWVNARHYSFWRRTQPALHRQHHSLHRQAQSQSLLVFFQIFVCTHMFKVQESVQNKKYTYKSIRDNEIK